jgi:uncharacterized protein YrrD
MLHRASELSGYSLRARTGQIGTVGDFYFDDHSWLVQCLVAHTGTGLSGRLVVIVASALRSADPAERVLAVDLTTEEIAHGASPDVGRALSQYHPHLRSTYAITGCHIQAADGALGHVEDFVIDDAGWAIRYLMVDTRNWWHGKHVLLSPQWVERVNWTDAKVFVALHRDTIKEAPEYSPDTAITRDYEAALYAHYRREGYW